MATTGAAPIEGRPWVLASGIPFPQDVAIVRPSATFESGRVSGSTGCNRYTGGYTLGGEMLALRQVASTLMACVPPADRIERDFLAALGRVSGWRLDGEELVLLGADGADLLRFTGATPVGTWQMTGLLRGDAFSSPIAGTELTAPFATDGTLDGSSGCNRYRASFTFDRGAITITPGAGTRKACAEPDGVMEQEAAYVSALPASARYRVDGRALELSDANGVRLVVYARTL
jgi:heat shock protein HslJ